MKNYLIILLAIFFISNTYSQNQIISRLKQPPPNRLTISDLWELQLNNITNKDIKGYIVGTLSEDNAGLIVEGKSKIFNIKSGNNLYSYNDFSDADFRFTNNQYKEIFLRSGNAPEGDYTICLTVYNENDEVIGRENCITHSVRLPGNVFLISPEDGEEVDVEQPLLFSWTPLSGVNQYNIRIVEVLEGQSPAVAIEQNRPLVDKNISGVNNFQLSKTEFKSFLRGIERKDIKRSFAWRISAGESKSDIYVWKCCKSAFADKTDLNSLEIAVFNICESKKNNDKQTQINVFDDDCDDSSDLIETLSEIFNEEEFVRDFKKMYVTEQEDGILCRIITHEGLPDTANIDKNKHNKAELIDAIAKGSKSNKLGEGGRTVGAGQITEIIKKVNPPVNNNLLVLVFAENEKVLHSVILGNNVEEQSDSTYSKMTLNDVKGILVAADFEESGAISYMRKIGGKKFEEIINSSFKNDDWDKVTKSNTGSLINLTIKSKNIPQSSLQRIQIIHHPQFYLSIPDGLFSEEQTKNIMKDFEQISLNLAENWWGEYKGTLELFRVYGNKNRTKEIDGLVAETDDNKRIRQLDNQDLQDTSNQQRRNAEADIRRELKNLYTRDGEFYLDDLKISEVDNSHLNAVMEFILKIANDPENRDVTPIVIVAKQIGAEGKCPPADCGCDGNSGQSCECVHLIKTADGFCACKPCLRQNNSVNKEKKPKKEKPVKSTQVNDSPWTEAYTDLGRFLIIFSPEAETKEELSIRIDNALTQIASFEEQEGESSQSNKEKPDKKKNIKITTTEVKKGHVILMKQ